MITILQKEHPALRAKAHEVPSGDIGTKRFADMITAMRAALRTEEDAVAIAAPQIGVPLRVFIVSGKVFAEENAEDTESAHAHDAVFINPEIIKRSRKTQDLEEGCLSVRWWYGHVKRADKVTVRAHDDKGRIFTRGASGLLAQIFQHEIDHLNGVLFTDKAKNLREMPPEKESGDKNQGL
ncbi:MAG: peptide deformylase [Parcubacteria group bacterium]|nr:peptide deformylase [Parcubacteria group bacterium]